MIINPQGKQLFLTNGCTVGQKVGFMNSIGNYVSLKITLTVNFTCNLGSMLMAIRCGCQTVVVHMTRIRVPTPTFSCLHFSCEMWLSHVAQIKLTWSFNGKVSKSIYWERYLIIQFVDETCELGNSWNVIGSQTHKNNQFWPYIQMQRYGSHNRPYTTLFLVETKDLTPAMPCLWNLLYKGENVFGDR